MGDIKVSATVTGSVGMGVAENLQIPFMQEVSAATQYTRYRYPEASALIDIGGEDAKIVFFDEHSTDLRMNGNCAGGTGAFIDQMAVLLDVETEQLDALAHEASHIHPIAARCGVFSKTDIQNLMSRNVPKSDITASIFHAVAVQTIVTLARGHNIAICTCKRATFSCRKAATCCRLSVVPSVWRSKTLSTSLSGKN